MKIQVRINLSFSSILLYAILVKDQNLITLILHILESIK